MRDGQYDKTTANNSPEKRVAWSCSGRKLSANVDARSTLMEKDALSYRGSPHFTSTEFQLNPFSLMN